MIAENIGINIASNIIYDVFKKIYDGVNPEAPRIRKQIEKYVRDNISNEFDLRLAIDGFEQFFKLPQVRDIINSYIIYHLNGTISEKLAQINDTHASVYLDENAVLEYLVRCFQDFYNYSLISTDEEYCPDNLIPITPEELSNCFSCIFSLADNFLVSQLDLTSKIGIFEVNRKLNHGFALVMEKLDRYGEIIESALKYPLVKQEPNYNQIRIEYMQILKKKHNKALIYLLDDFDLDRFYIPPTLSASVRGKVAAGYLFMGSRPSRQVLSESWTNIFARENIIYITGGAGYGKSLLMKNIIINSDKLNITDSVDHIVIYGEIKWFINKDGSFKSLTDFLRVCITNSTLKDLNEDFIDYHLKVGRCILLLDALDEVPMEKRKDLHQTIIAHLKNLNPNNKVCLTSRDRGFIPVEEEIEHFNIEPLNAEQIEKYVEKIIKLGKFNPKDKEPFMQQAQGLVEKRFLNSFLILSLLINIYKGERELPETKLELYQKCLEYISNKRERPKTDNFDWKLIAHLMKDNTFIELALLCFPNNKEAKESEIIAMLSKVYQDVFIDKATLENAISEFLKFCSERTELFVPANVESSFKFFHRSFFEYFYSKHIVIRCEESSAIYEKLRAFDVDSEVFELTLARLKQETQDKYISLINYVFTQCESDFRSKEPNFKACNILVLFFQVIDEATFQLKFVHLIMEHSQLIVNHINKLSNQEIVHNTIIEADALESIIATYKYAAYNEVFQALRGVNVETVKLALERVSERKPDWFQEQTTPSQILSSTNCHFYTAALITKYDMITILANLINELGIGRKHKARIRNLIKYFNTLDTHHKELCNELLEIFLRNTNHWL